MADTVNTNVVINYNAGFSPSAYKPCYTCKSCKYENKDYGCDHPKNGTKEFNAIEMEQCYKYNGRTSYQTRFYKKSKGKK